MDPRPNRRVHAFAVFTACCTFLLLVAGALVTSNDAGLAVPDWPLSYGSLLPPMVGGIFYEHGHRMIATFVGLLSIILAVWLWRVESRRWVRWLGVAALGAVVAQGILGGITVLFFLPAPISAAHATLAQIFFCTVVSIALFTSGWWQRERPIAVDGQGTAIHSLGVATAGATLLQLVLGAAFRHKGFGIDPHLAGAALVAGMVFWFSATLRFRFPDVPLLRNSARVLHAFIGTQLLLGGAAWWSRMYSRQFPQPIPIMVTFTVAHTVFGALLLATVVLVTLACYRLVRPLPVPGTAAIGSPAGARNS
jgi:cytochrome c oxidase assembly protein subunit 15